MTMNSETNPPINIRAHQAEGELEVVWAEQESQWIPYRLLRGRCPCAGCVDEMTGERTFDVDQVSDGIHPKEMGFSGNYALKIAWNDGHHTGLFTWKYLREIGDEEESSSD